MAGGVPVVAKLAALQRRGKGKRSWNWCPLALHPILINSFLLPSWGGRGILSRSPSIPRVSYDSGTITLRCKDLRVLQLDIEGVEATLDIARSIEVRQRCS